MYSKPSIPLHKKTEDMESKAMFLNVYTIGNQLSEGDILISSSYKFIDSSIQRNRYFLQFGEEGRKKIKSKLGTLLDNLKAPNSISEIIQNRFSEKEITFLGVTEFDNQISYKLYFGFSELHDKKEEDTAYAVGWAPSQKSHKIYIYDWHERIEAEIAIGQLENIFSKTKDVRKNGEKKLLNACRSIIERCDFTYNYLNIREEENDRKSIDFSLVENQSIKVAHCLIDIEVISNELGIPYKEFEKWNFDLDHGAIIEHLGAGCDNKGSPFVTFYVGHPKQPTFYQPIINQLEVKLTPNIVQNSILNLTKTIKNMENEQITKSIQTDISANSNVVIQNTDDNRYDQPTIIIEKEVNHHEENHHEQSITPSSCSCRSKEHHDGGLVYAIGHLHFDFLTDSKRDSFTHHLGKELSLKAIIEHMKKYTYVAEELAWVLMLNDVPIYAIKPRGPFAREGYEMLIDFFIDIHKTGSNIERIAVPGIIDGKTVLLSGQEVPTVTPILRGMASWNTKMLVESVSKGKGNSNHANRLNDFLSRIYFELQNRGRSSAERALNYSATNLFQISKIFEEALKSNLQLSDISAEKSKFVRPDRDLWDVQVIFFNPSKRLEEARKVYGFTIDTTEPVPTTIGDIRHWSIY